MTKPEGIYPLTSIVLDVLTSIGVEPPKIDVHEIEDSNTYDNEPDCIWIELTPDLSLSKGEYMMIEKSESDNNKYWFNFGTRAAEGLGSDATYGDGFVDSNKASALHIASMYLSVLTGEPPTHEIIESQEEESKLIIVDEANALLRSKDYVEALKKRFLNTMN